MTKHELYTLLENAPVIAAVKSDAGLAQSLACESGVVFILYGDVNCVADIVQAVHKAGKLAFVHIDLIAGLSPKEAAVDYLARATRADGVISTKSALIRRARALGLLTVQRFFVLDSLSMETIRRPEAHRDADFIEVLPGLMPKIIRALAGEVPQPIIAGGLISEKEDVVTALSAGALAVSSTNSRVWAL